MRRGRPELYDPRIVASRRSRLPERPIHGHLWLDPTHRQIAVQVGSDIGTREALLPEGSRIGLVPSLRGSRQADGGTTLKITPLLFLAMLAAAGCALDDPLSTRGSPGSQRWFASANWDERLAYYSEICRDLDGMLPGTPQMDHCAQRRIQIAAQNFYRTPRSAE